MNKKIDSVIGISILVGIVAVAWGAIDFSAEKTAEAKVKAYQSQATYTQMKIDAVKDGKKDVVEKVEGNY